LVESVGVKVVAIDPGSRKAGYAVFEIRKKGILLSESGTFSVKGKELPQRLLSLHRNLERLFQRHKPREVAIEKTFMGKSVTSGITLSSARAICLLAAAKGNARIFDYAPAQVKKAIWPNGQADKGTIQRAVQLHLELEELPPPDEADAIALGLCHLNRNPGTEDWK
jgi:crossover junction endodeoxyribonuclease RuvC